MKTQRRRRLEKTTDYKARLALLKSKKPRLVVRKSNRYINAQIVESNLAQDKIISSVSSKDLLEKGWPKENSGSLKSLSAAYLTGFMLGKKLKGKLGEVVLDLGLQRNVQGSRIYSLVKGTVDSGIAVIHDKKALPTEERINSNEKLKKIFSKVKEKI